MNLRQLAALLKLSPATVSRALNGFPEVNAETRERVLAAAAQHGYRPNTIARKLATGRTDSIGLIYPFEPSDLGDPVFLDVIAGITERLAEAQMDLIIVSAAQANELATYHRMVSAARVDGLIVARTLVNDPRLHYLQERGFPFVAHGRSHLTQPYPWFDYDNEAGMRLAVRRLLQFGHRDIGLISAPLRMNFASQRREGFLQELEQAGVHPAAHRLETAELNPSQGRLAMQRLLSAPSRPSAVVVDNNVAAVGAMQALREAGLTPGSDISVIVFGGLPLADGETSPISAVLQPEPRRAGQTMAELMLARLSGEPADTLTRLWQPVLRPGNSDAPLPRQGEPDGR
ncbi:substrate-binding domain-containing protein [Chromobacterium alticapitis]|uniref:LacI family transcriptional regulator n=1 Tax=Chromobacterium alticapitis TaxID=2073169 RepID=A0A2S5DK73_9NEIS|nr:substrate-binding domain-containing protein [Chromobacterium alticapitis]POZ63429.1 LacI family transcriptional regulator [Chromobacterium alticapitis]